MTQVIDDELYTLLFACWFSAQAHGWEARPGVAGEWRVSNVLLWWK